VPERVKRESRRGLGTGQARTRLARRAVVDAARALFLERGYAGTTIDAISDRADVPSPTVYRLFSSKLGILRALLDTSIAGDDQPVTVEERPDVASHFNRTDYTNCGFQLNVGRGQLTKGSHSVSVRVIANDKKSYNEGPVIQFTVN